MAGDDVTITPALVAALCALCSADCGRQGRQGKPGGQSRSIFPMQPGRSSKGNRVCGICRSAQGRSPPQPRACRYQDTMPKLANKHQDAKKQSKELCHCFKRRSTSSSHLDAGQNLRPAGSQPPARPPPNQEPSLICASTFDVAWRRSRRGFSLSLTAWYRDTASAESLQRLSRVSRHPRGCPPTPLDTISGRPSPLPARRVLLSILVPNLWLPSVTPTLGASF